MKPPASRSLSPEERTGLRRLIDKHRRNQRRGTGQGPRHSPKSGRPASPDLSQIQLAILQLSADGLTIPEIAEAAGRAPETVKSHRRKILLKLGTPNIAGAVAIGFRKELLS
jgi:DNA-binding NarL/FixJ family response regulator